MCVCLCNVCVAGVTRVCVCVFRECVWGGVCG